jgi:hypothetical protein
MLQDEANCIDGTIALLIGSQPGTYQDCFTRLPLCIDRLMESFKTNCYGVCSKTGKAEGIAV